jgi:hypothetical protein
MSPFNAEETSLFHILLQGLGASVAVFGLPFHKDKAQKEG